jgi:hypothetical protein
MGDKLSFEESERLLDAEMQPELDAIAKQQRGSYFMRGIKGVGSTLKGTLKGGVNAVADIVDTATDLAFYAGTATDLALGAAFDVGTSEKRKGDATASLEAMQKLRDGVTSYIRANETDDRVANFAMNTTESIAKFAMFYRSAIGAGASKGAAVMLGGFGEGFTDAPEREMLLMDKGLRLAVESVAPDALEDFDKMMDLKTDASLAKQLSKRVMSGIEIGLLSIAGEKAVGAAGQGLKAAGKALPQGMVDATKNGFMQVAERWRKTKEWAAGDKKMTLDQYIMKEGETAFKVNPGAMTPEASAKQNLRNAVQAEYESTMRVLSPEDYSAKLADYEKKLSDLAPQIEAEVVSMAKSRGLSETEQLAKFSKELGLEEADKMTQEGLKNVLRTQAHNIMLEHQAANFVMASGAFKKGMLPETEYLDAAKSLHTVIQQRMANLTGAGRTLRTAQEIPAYLQKVNKEIVASGRTLDDVVAAYGKTINDPEALKVLAQGMDDAMSLHGIMGDSSEEIMKSMAKAIAKVDTKKSKMDIAFEIGDAVGAIYQANLLSATWTLAQNTIGSAVMMLGRAFETGIEAGVSKVMGRHTGSATLKESMIQYKHIFEGHLDALLISGKAASQLAKGNYGEAGQTFRAKMTDMPEMTAKEREFMFRMRKEDMTQKKGDINEWISGNTYASFLSGRPVFDFIQLQDVTTKAAAARGYMRGRYDTAVYVDDVLGLGDGLVNNKQARDILDTMYKSGRDAFTPDELKALGLSTEKAIDVSQRLSKWRAQTSKEAREFGVEAAMQTPLTGTMKRAQEMLQDTIPGGRVFVPFFTTPANIINEALRRMPLVQIGEESALGLPIHPDFYKDFKAGGRRRQQAIARAVSGMTIVQLGAMMAENGSLQYVPKDGQVSQSMETIFNVNPGSIVIGGESFPLAAFGSWGLLLTYGGHIHQNSVTQDQLRHMSDEDQQTFADAMILNITSFMQTVKDAPYIKPVDDIISIFSFDPEDETAVQKAKEYAARMAGNLVPYSSLQRQTFQNFEEERKRANGSWEAFMSSFAPHANATAYNALGETMKNQQGIVARSKEVSEDQTMSRLFESGWYPRPAKFDMTVLGDDRTPSVQVRLNNAQWDTFNKHVRDSKLRFELDAFTKSDAFIVNSTLGRYDLNAKQADAMLNRARRNALDKMMREDVVLRSMVEEARKGALIENNKGRFAPAGTTPTFQGVR